MLNYFQSEYCSKTKYIFRKINWRYSKKNIFVSVIKTPDHFIFLFLFYTFTIKGRSGIHSYYTEN